MKGNHLPNPITGEQSLAEIIAEVSAKEAAKAAMKPYTGNPEAADRVLDQRLVELSAAGQHPPAGLSLRDLRRWADLAERRMDAQRIGAEEDAAEAQWLSEQQRAHAEVDARKQAEAQARAEAKVLVDGIYGGIGGGR